MMEQTTNNTMTSSKKESVLVSDYSNMHLSAVGIPPELQFIYGTDLKNRENETFEMSTALSVNNETPELTATISHVTGGRVYDLTARDGQTVTLEPRDQLSSAINETGRHFRISQEELDHKSYLLMESVDYKGNFLCSFDNSLQLRTIPEDKEKRTAFYFSFIPFS